MKQQNRYVQHHCEKELLTEILNCPEFDYLPNLFTESWQTISNTDDHLDERIGNAKKAIELWETNPESIEREPYHFITMLLGRHVYEGVLTYYEDVKNEYIENKCKGGLTTEHTIKLAKVKVALVCRYLRFIKSALNSYSEIIKEYNSLPKKTHITQKIVDDELATKLALSQMNQSLSGQTPASTRTLTPKNVDMPYPMVDTAKKFGIPFKELRSNYPTYRSAFSSDTQFTYCIWTYAYYFFIHNFTYDKKEDATIFAYSTMEYIKHLIHDTIYNPPIESTSRSILDGIGELKQQSPYNFNYQDIFQCDFKINSDFCSIGIYFPNTNQSFTENIPQ